MEGRSPGTEPTPPIPQETLPTEEELRTRLVADLVAARTYPPAARRRGTEGTVRLNLRWVADGTLTGLDIGRPSGSAVLDQAGMELVRSVFPRPNPLGRELRFQVALEYRLTAPDGQR